MLSAIYRREHEKSGSERKFASIFLFPEGRCYKKRVERKLYRVSDFLSLVPAYRQAGVIIVLMSSHIPYSKPVVIVDVETTGGNATDNRLIEIGIIRVENGKEVSRYQSLINPRQSVPLFVQRLTGISDADLVTAPSFDEIAHEVEQILKDALFIGHNVRFDYDFVRHELRRMGKRYIAPTLCSARFSRALFPEHKRHNLGEIVERHGLSIESHHRALDDAQAVWDFLKFCSREKGQAKFLEIFEKLARGRPVQSLIPPEQFDEIPESAGVYVFRDSNGKALYVGKSSNLREKILGHFYGDFESAREAELQSRAAKLEWFATPGELSALFLESEKILSLQPEFARKIAGSSAMICAVKKIDAAGYAYAELALEKDVEHKKNILGYYRGFREAKQALAGLSEKFKVGILSDPSKKQAAGQNSASAHNAKFDRAFEQGGSEFWPFPSAVLIDEKDESLNSGQAFIVQNWILIARIFYDADGRKVEKLGAGFDWDKFKLLKRALKNPSQVKPLTADDLQKILVEK